jgi:hypothetical protein
MKAMDATKKNPRQSTRLASTESLPLNLGFWLGGRGVFGGWAFRLVGLIPI